MSVTGATLASAEHALQEGTRTTAGRAGDGAESAHGLAGARPDKVALELGEARPARSASAVRVM